MFDVKLLLCWRTNTETKYTVRSSSVYTSERKRGRTTGRNIAPSERHAARTADEVQPPEVVRLAQRVLLPVLALDGEELGGHDLVAVLFRRVKETKEEGGGDRNKNT